MSKKDIPVLYKDDEEIALPWKWEICPACDGHNTDHGRSVECDGGGFTSSEWNDLDDDFRQDYLNGVYDKPCPHCENGKVKVVDEDKLEPAVRSAYIKQCEDDADYERECAWERKMGC